MVVAHSPNRPPHWPHNNSAVSGVYPTGYSHSPTRPINGNAKSAVMSCPAHHTGKLCPIPASHFGAIMPTTFGKTTPPSPTSGAGAQNPMGRPSPETDAARHRARQSVRECELIWLLQQRLRAVSWPHWRLRCMQPHCTATAWEFSDLDHSHAATPQRVTRASCAQLLRFVLGAACR